MQTVSLKLTSKFAHFKKPETNNNPCTYAFMHKCAFLGFMGAVLGIQRGKMNFEQYCNDFLYGIKTVNPVFKESASFTQIKITPNELDEYFKNGKKGIRYIELLVNPCYEITLTLKNTRATEMFEKFVYSIKHQETCFPVYLGIASCQCDFEYLGEFECSVLSNGVFETEYIFSFEHKVSPTDVLECVCDKLPIAENNDWQYTQYTNVVSPNKNTKVNGNYYQLSNGTTLWMI